MKLAVYLPAQVPTSQDVYRKNLMAQFERRGITLAKFGSGDETPHDADLMWVPSALMRELFQVARKTRLPVVASLHGPFSFSLPLRELEAGTGKRMAVWLKGKLVDHWWRTEGNLISGVIASSQFGARECHALTRLPGERIYPVYPGIDLELFQPQGETVRRDKPYFFHNAARLTPRKNSRRIFTAFQKTELASHDLVAIVPEMQEQPTGVQVMTSRVSQAELTGWYRGAAGFVYPSLHETFGVAMMEAMACGCPVITSNQTACPEVVGDAALTVDPRSVSALAEAMCRLAMDADLRAALRRKGLQKASEYSWEASAQAHLQTFARHLSSV